MGVPMLSSRDADSGTEPASMLPQRLALAALALAGLGLVAGVVLAPPPLPLQPSGLLPWLAAVAGLAGGGLALLAGGGRRPTEVPEANPAVVMGLQTVVRELRGLLQDERDELATLRAACGTATHDAMKVGARLASVALDAEARLVAGVAQAEDSLVRPDGALARATEAGLWLERALPDLRALATAPARPPMPDLTAPHESAGLSERAVATQLLQAAEAAVHTLTRTTAQTGGQLTALGEAADTLRRDAASLDAAGRQIAAAGASVVARVGEAVGHADQVLRRLPEAGQAVSEAAEQAAHTLSEAASMLGADAAALDEAGRENARAAAAIRQDAAAIGVTGQDLEGTAADLLGRLTEMLAADGPAGHLMETMRQADAAWRQEAARQADIAERTRLTSEELSVAATALHAAAGTTVTALTQVGDTVSTRVAGIAVQAEEALAGLARVPAVAAGLARVAASLREEGESLGDIGLAVIEAGKGVAAVLAMDTQAITAERERATSLLTDSAQSARDMTRAAADLAREAGAVQADLLLAARALSQTTEAAAVRIEGVTALAEDALAGLGRVPAVAAGLARVSASLREQSDSLGDIGLAVIEAGKGVAAVLAADVLAIASERERATVLLAKSMQAAHEMTQAASALGRTADTVSADLIPAARGVSEAGDAAAQRVQSIATQAEEALAGLARVPAVAAGLARVAATLREEGEGLGQIGFAVIEAGRGVATVLAADAQAIAIERERASTLLAESAQGARSLVDAAIMLRADAAGLKSEAAPAIATLTALARDAADRIEAALRGLPTIAADAVASALSAPLAAACEQVAQTMAEAGAVLCADSAALDASGRENLQAAALLRQQADTLLSGADGLSGGAGDLVARLSDAASRLESAVAEAAAQQAMTESRPDPADRLTDRLAEAAAELRLEAAQLTEAGRDVAVTAHLADAALRQVPTLVSDITAASLGLQREASDLAARIEHAARGASADHGGQALLDALARLESVLDALAAAAPTQDTTATGGPPDRDNQGASLTATLRHLGGVEHESAILLREAEALAMSVLGGHAPRLPDWLDARTPALLGAVESTIQRLRSVATALALASDGPPAPPAAQRHSA